MSNVEGSGGLPPGFPDIPGMSGGGMGAPTWKATSKGESLQQWIEGFLGPEGWKKFQANLCSMINNQIQAEQSKAHDAAQKLKKAESGDDD
jgi:hypothetical protein